MIVVSKDQQLHSNDVALTFLVNVIGPRYASKILATFTTISSFGNVVGQTFTASRVKQEIAKEGIIPFAKFFGENKTLFRRYRTQKSDHPEPTPVGALFLHWLCAVGLILITWPTKPTSAYRILVNLTEYLTEVLPSFTMAIGMLCLHIFTNWSRKSPLPSWLSISAALIYAITNGFPLVSVFIPPTRNYEIHDIIPGFPWYMTAVLSWVILICGGVYWAHFRYILPRIGRRRGKEFIVEREPIFRVQNGERVQWHEIVRHSWVVKSEPRSRGQYVLGDVRSSH
jgi:amino acid transporter